MKIVWIQTLALLGMIGALLAGAHFQRHPPTLPSLMLPSLTLPPPPSQDAPTASDEDLVQVLESAAVPRWVRPPAPVASDYPTKALRAGASGEAVITCYVSPLGRPTGCEIASETPPGLGFGPAARRIVERGQLTLPIIEDDDPGSPQFTVRVPFHLD